MSTDVEKIDIKVYAGRARDENILMQSSSGGGFTVISDWFLESGYAIVCAVYNYSLHVEEFRLITTRVDRNAARGSKYIQSKPGDIFAEAAKWLNDNPQKKILFVGMGCQAEGFRKFADAIGVRDRVWIVDIVCHGSPSPRLWREYVNFLEKKNNGKLINLSFKDKRNGWKHPTAKADINGKEIILSDYVRIFYKNCALRPSCHKCPFTTTERSTDMTIGDFWHIEDRIPDFYDERGNSLFLIHTYRGEELFDSIKDGLDYRESNTIDCWQNNLDHPTPVSEKRAQFWIDYKQKGVEYIVMKYGTASFKTKIKNKIVRTLSKVLQPPCI